MTDDCQRNEGIEEFWRVKKHGKTASNGKQRIFPARSCGPFSFSLMEGQPREASGAYVPHNERWTSQDRMAFAN